MQELNGVVARLDGESEFDAHRRLIREKLELKTLQDVDYAELAEAVYGQPYSSDTARRMMYGSKKTLDLLERYAGSPESTCSDDADAIRRETQRFYDQRREYRRLVTKDSRLEHLEERMASAAEQLRSTVGNVFSGDIRFNNSGSEAVVVFSDWHYGMTANNIWNTYSKDECVRRVKAVTEAACERIVRHGCRMLTVFVLGDLIHGAIHTSARVASDELVVDQIMESSEILAQAVLEMSRYVDSVRVLMTYGNHARTVQSKNDNIHRDNMERVIPWWLKQRFIGTDVKVEEDSGTEFLSADICGHCFCAAHGDLDSAKGSIRMLSTLFNKQYGKDVEYILLGDKHHYETVEGLGIEMIQCSSLCGTDEYANSKRLYATPSQLMFIVNEEDGIDATYKLSC